MPSVTSWGVERVQQPEYSLDSDSLAYLNNVQDNINTSLGSSNQNQLSARSGISGLLGSMDLNGVASGVIGGLNGILQTENTANQLSQMYGDQSAYNTQMANLRSQLYATNETIDQALSLQGYPIKKQTAEDFRGLTRGQRNGLVASTALSGAGSGASIGAAIGSIIPGLGTVAGGLIGGAAGAIGGFIRGKHEDKQGEQLAQSNANYANYNADMMMQNLQTNREADINRIQLRDNAESAVHAVANGGNIERKQMDIRSFANKTLGKKDYPDRPVRRMTKGGVMVRFKVK